MRSTSARSAVADGPRSHQPLGRPGGRVHIGTPNEVAVEVPVFGRMAIERVIRYAIERARERRHDLASITKSNTSRCAYVLWDEVAAGLSSEYPDVRVERVALMLQHLGFPDAARRLEAAIARTVSEGRTLTLDLGGSATTIELGDPIVGAL